MKNLFLQIFLVLQVLFSQSIKKSDKISFAPTGNLHDTVIYNHYLQSGQNYQNNNPDTAIYFYTLAEKQAGKISGPEGEIRKAEAIRRKGWAYYLKSHFDMAMVCFNIAIRVIKKHIIHHDAKIRKRALIVYASCLNNRGIIYIEKGQYTHALTDIFLSLKINEETENKIGIAKNLNNIGLVHYAQKNHQKALEYYMRALETNKVTGDKFGQANDMSNIGVVYMIQGKYQKALEYYFKALEINEEIRNKHGQSINLTNIGIVYQNLKDLDKAIEFYQKALKIDREINNTHGMAICLCNIGYLYYIQEKYEKAEQYLLKSLIFHKNLGSSFYLLSAYKNLSDIYLKKSKFKEALDYLKESVKVQDSLINSKNRKDALQKEMQHKFEKEQALKEKEHQKKIELERKEKEKQRIITWFVAVALFSVAVFLGFIVNRLNITRKQKSIIEQQKKIVEEQKLIVEEQKKLVEQKNKDILDSINYAKRIQNAILPSFVKMNEYLNQYFVLYLPKDIVAGDFYWLETSEKYVFVAVADCTGHGVPGAMVSVVCSNALSKAVLEDKITDSDNILNRTRELVIEKLTSEDNIRDGMDVCLVRIEKDQNIIQFSGANRPLYIKSPHATKIMEIIPDKQPIGRYENSKPFSKTVIELKQNSLIFLTTDGYADQFGGNKGKKIGTKKFKELLYYIATHHHAEEQKEKLLSYFINWKENEEQTDDITIIGLKL
ncbi:MAG: tetratricopeptide repeat protein [Bacteroidia bacterium]|nr:tetratricopeptide repeat protein [Bacteroidia bacterium]